MRTYIILIFFFASDSLLLAQDKTREVTQLSLQEVIAIAQQQSIAAYQAKTAKETQYWEWRSFQANYRPQLLLSGNLPDFLRSFREVVQPNGTIDFQSVTINNSILDFSLSQQLVATGGSIFIGTQLQRFDDFSRDRSLYNGVPLNIGFTQPFFGFNALKWDKKIAPIIYEESQRAYVEDLEAIALEANSIFFQLITAQVNLEIAQNNLLSIDTILTIAQERFTLGKISRDEVLQLQLERLNSQKGVAKARQTLGTAALRLKIFSGISNEADINLTIPDRTTILMLDEEVALQEAYQNRADALAFQRRKLEGAMGVAKAKGETGFSINLFASFGLSKSAERFGDLFEEIQDQERIIIQFELPILDWGRSKAKRETAKASKQFIEYAVQQDQQSFEEEILTQVRLFTTLQDQLKLSEDADLIAAERYQIAKDRYRLGDLSITDLNIALREKDQAKRDYILALQDYWTAYYYLRVLTLYDFEKQQKIKY